MTSCVKLTLTSKKPREQYTRFAPRKPVKECYCYLEVNKANLRSSRTRRRTASPSRQCTSNFELRPVKETNDRAVLTSPISCETYRRVRKIDYTPRSQFLRNVQNRICEWQSGGQGDCSQTCPRSLSYHRIMASARIQDIDSDREIQPNAVKCVEGRKSSATPKTPANSIASESDRNIVCTSNKETRTSLRKRSKSMLRKMISKRPTSRSPTQGERMSRSHDHNYRCCCRDEPKSFGDGREKKHSSEYHEQRIRRMHTKCDDDPVDSDALADPIDQEMKDLKRFRAQNYFETHGSSHTLASSRSSGSLEQYLLNERLFPEPVSKIHRQDLVVTMPPCTTTERKRIHYFPKHVVYQEKNVYNTNYRRKRHQSCPLTGHAIDLGILKARPPLNSLALKYQKRAT
ncbi:hypothetical protein EAI_11380 [Harpegnathos saltator]|uniref:Uncharacterized protein n=2 Tax=Harpegnathos saltator TaxID=610380 RepID=E2BXE4_HARSA|nr:hypothetical protein EAI_11380 [Harpegnathos saltator]